LVDRILTLLARRLSTVTISFSSSSSVGFFPLATSSLVKAEIAPRNVSTRTWSRAFIASFMSSRIFWLSMAAV